MSRLIYEFTESVRIAFGQIGANKMRSVLTALGVIIGIMAVSLMGTAINGIDRTFQNSLDMLGEDVLYIERFPWTGVRDPWNFRNRPNIRMQDAEALNRVIATTPNTELQVAVPVLRRSGTIKFDANRLTGIQIFGTTAEYVLTTSFDFAEGRLFSDTESVTGRQVCVLGADVAESLFPGISALDRRVLINDQPFTVIGVLAREGAFLGLFSFDNQVVIPITAFRRYFGSGGSAQLRVKIADASRLGAAVDELTGAMRRVRGQLPGERDNFSINQQQAFRDQLAPVKAGIAIAGLFITGLSLFVGAIGIMNITFVSVKERTREIGMRKALGARRRTILLQFLIEAVSICVIGGIIGLVVTYAAEQGVRAALPSFPVEFSAGLVMIGMIVSVATGVASGFAPAWGASRLDPVEALRYE